MPASFPIRLGRGVIGAAGASALAYGTIAGLTWYRYGRSRPPITAAEADDALDRFLPDYEVRDHHHLEVAAPADVTFAAACALDLNQSRLVRGLFQTRAWVMGASGGPSRPEPQSFLAYARSIGWGVLHAAPGREVIMGAVTRPWEADVTFRAVPPEEFRTFAEPDYVKIAWTLRADPVGAAASIVRTETRVTTTDAGARERFRRYWSVAAPGILCIRWVALRLIKRAAER